MSGLGPAFHERKSQPNPDAILPPPENLGVLRALLWNRILNAFKSGWNVVMAFKENLAAVFKKFIYLSIILKSDSNVEHPCISLQHIKNYLSVSSVTSFLPQLCHCLPVAVFVVVVILALHVTVADDLQLVGIE